MSKVVQLEIPNSPDYVIVARKAVEGIATRLGLSQQQVEDLRLAVGEACTNAVKFSSPGEPRVQVSYRLEPDRLEIEVQNRGKPFPEGNLPPEMPSADCLQNGGMGLYLVNQVMDELTICSAEGTTTLRMVKRLNRRS